MLKLAILILAAVAMSGQSVDSYPRKLAAFTIATLPTPAAGMVAVVTDAATAGSCTSGSGSSRALCRYSGSAWVSLGGCAGGGATAVDDDGAGFLICTGTTTITCGVDSAVAATKISTTRVIGVAVGDPAGSTLATGVLGYTVVPAACTIIGWDIVVDAGTATVDIWKVATGTAKPVDANSITASAVPAISTGTAVASTTLTGWTTSVASGDIVGFNLDAVATAKFIMVGVRCR